MAHKKKLINLTFEVLDVFLSDEGFSCSLDVPYGGLGISKLHFLIKKRRKKISAVFFSSFLVIITLDPDSLKIMDPDSLSGSTTLHYSLHIGQHKHECARICIPLKFFQVNMQCVLPHNYYEDRVGNSGNLCKQK